MNIETDVSKAVIVIYEEPNGKKLNALLSICRSTNAEFSLVPKGSHFDDQETESHDESAAVDAVVKPCTQQKPVTRIDTLKDRHPLCVENEEVTSEEA